MCQLASWAKKILTDDFRRHIAVTLLLTRHTSKILINQGSMSSEKKK